MQALMGTIVENKTPEQWAQVIRADLGQAVAGFVAAGRHLTQAKQQLPHGTWESWCRSEVGISAETARRLREIAEHPSLSNPNHGLDLPPSWQTLYELSRLEGQLLEAAIQARRVHPELERRDAKILVIEYKQAAAQVRFDVRHGEFQALDVEPGSVDAIITDPPYPKDFLPLYSDLSKCAAEWLRPGGICAVMSGQTHLPEVITRLSENLAYWWTIAYLTPGGQAVQVFPRKVNTFWKPVLIFRNGEGPASDWFGDVTKSDVNDNDKRFHHWGQSESGMADLVKRLTSPGDLIADPFMGAATTGIAAILSGRSFVGCDVNKEHVENAEERLGSAVMERLGVMP